MFKDLKFNDKGVAKIEKSSYEKYMTDKGVLKEYLTKFNDATDDLMADAVQAAADYGIEAKADRTINITTNVGGSISSSYTPEKDVRIPQTGETITKKHVLSIQRKQKKTSAITELCAKIAADASA